MEVQGSFTEKNEKQHQPRTVRNFISPTEKTHRKMYLSLWGWEKDKDAHYQHLSISASAIKQDKENGEEK